jgi:hypothetical protein
MKTYRELFDGTILIVTVKNGEYDARIEPSSNLGFEGSFGKVKNGETAETIADELAHWLNVNS